LAEERGAVPGLLVANKERRQRAAAEAQAARQELRDLLLRGQAAAMDVSDMADEAGVSRDTAHRILKEAGSMSWRQKQRWAKEVVDRIPRDTVAQNTFKAIVNMLLLKALGSNPEDVPRSVEGILEDAAGAVREREPGFQPQYPPALAHTPWPTPSA
jgi:DnaJ-domain-containing protein 1